MVQRASPAGFPEALPTGCEPGDVLARLADDGFCVVEGLLSPHEVAAARRELEPVLETTPRGRNPFEGYRTRRVYALFAKVRCFDGPLSHPLVEAVATAVLGHHQLSAAVAIEIGPGEVAQSLHHDDAVYPLARPHPEVVLNTMWALDRFTAANGATRLVPGSHRWPEGRRPGPGDPTVPATMDPGSVLFYLGSLWHGGGANRTDRPRLGVILELCAGWVRPQENHLLAVPPEVVAGLDDRLAELLGYNVHPPFLGYVDGRHPLRVLRRRSGPAVDPPRG